MKDDALEAAMEWAEGRHIAVKSGGEIIRFGMVLAAAVRSLQDRLKEMEDRPATDSNCGYLPCGHNGYWQSIYGNCMVCRCEKAEAENRLLKDAEHFQHSKRLALENADLRSKLATAKAEGRREAFREVQGYSVEYQRKIQPLATQWDEGRDRAMRHLYDWLESQAKGGAL